MSFAERCTATPPSVEQKIDESGTITAMKSMLKICLCAMICVSSIPAFSANNGCIIQGSLTGNNIRQVSNYCLANRGVSDLDFRQMCQDLFETEGGGAGGKKEDNSISMKYVGNCPTSSRGVCEDAFGYKVNLIYLPGDDSHKYANPKLICETGGGKWKQ